jgi:hypothetical protein
VWCPRMAECSVPLQTGYGIGGFGGAVQP